MSHAFEASEAAEWFDVFMDNTPAVCFIKDDQGRYVYVNRRFEQINNTRLADLAGRRASDWLREAEARALEDEDRLVRETGRPVERLHESQDKTGARTYWQMIKFRLVTGDGAVCVAGVSIDVTAEHTARDLVREQLEILQQANDVVIVRDLDGKIRFWNHAAEELYGWSSAEMVDSTGFEQLYDEHRRAEIEQIVETVLERGSWRGELHQKSRQQNEVIVQSRWSLLRARNGSAKAILVISTDITERRHFEHQLLRTQRLESLGAIASGLAHDLNNMLMPITMGIAIIRRFTDHPRITAALTSMEKSSRRAAELVKQLLTFVRGGSTDNAAIAPRLLIEEVRVMIEQTFPSNIHLVTEVADEVWKISANPTQMHQVMVNLCVNARDAMPQGGNLTIQASNFIATENYTRLNLEAKPGYYVLIRVTDTGTGMSQATLARIFEPFFTTKTPDKGTGLGLSTVMMIVKAHGGFVTAYSEPGQGTTFKVYIPALTAPKSEIADEMLSIGEGGKGELVLLVEDEDAIREIARQTLETYGYRVLLASDGSEAIAMYVQNQSEIAVVITDMMMPIMDGPSTIRALLKINPQAKIIAASGLLDNVHVADFAGRVQAFLQKPFTAERLLRTLDEVLKRAE